MHYYKFNIGDYRRQTHHLTLLEHGIYRSLIDTYYLTEQPLCGDSSTLMRTHSIRTDEEIKAFSNVLVDFFVMEDGKFIHTGCGRRIDEYQEKSEKARKSAHKRWGTDANAVRTQCEGNANHKPLTTNQEPIKEKETWEPPIWVNPQSWKEFEQHRKETQQPLTDMARTKAANQLKDLTPEQQQQTVDMTIQNRWRGLFPEKRVNNHEQRKPRTAVERVEAACNSSITPPAPHGQIVGEND